MSNFINKIKKDSVLKDIQDARIEAIDSSVVENSVNPVEGGAVFTALAGKQDTLTAGSNIDISNGVISATDTTYTAGTNIDITNGVISVVGELGVDDYNDLDNKPIINQDLEAVGFTPVANTYYRHTGEGSGLEALTIGQTLSNGDKIHFDTSKESQLLTFLQNVDWTQYEEGLLMAGSSEESPLIYGFTDNGVYGVFVLSDTGALGDFDVIYMSEDMPDLATAGWHNLDANGDYTINISSSSERTINTITDTNPPSWNGIIVGTAAASQYISGKIYFYDGEEYKAIDGSGAPGEGVAVIETIGVISGETLEPIGELSITTEEFEEAVNTEISFIKVNIKVGEEGGQDVIQPLYAPKITKMSMPGYDTVMFSTVIFMGEGAQKLLSIQIGKEGEREPGVSFSAQDIGGGSGTSDYFELENAPFKEVPETEISAFEVGTKLNKLCIDASTRLTDIDNYDWDNYSPDQDADKIRYKVRELTYTDSEPADPQNYDYWYDNGTLKKYLGNSWITCSNMITISDGNYYKVAKTPNPERDDYNFYYYTSGSMNEFSPQTGSRPSDPQQDQFWYDTNDTQNLYQYDGSDWQLVSTTNVYGLTYMFDGGSQAKLFKNEYRESMVMLAYTGHEDSSLYIMLMKPEDDNKLLAILGWRAFSDGSSDISAYLYSTGDYLRYGIQSGWMKSTGIYNGNPEELDSDDTIQSLYHTSWWADNLKSASIPFVEGQYYKEADIEESKEYLSDGLSTSSIAFDITSDPNITTTEIVPDHTFYISFEGAPDFLIYNGSSWEQLSVQVTEESEPSEPTEGMYWFCVMTYLLKQYVSGEWVEKTYTPIEGETPPENPQAGDIVAVGLIPFNQKTLLHFSFNMGEEYTYYIQDLWANLGDEKMELICMAPIEISTAGIFMSMIEDIEEMSLYMQEGSPEGEWNTSTDYLSSEGIMQMPFAVTLSIPSDVQSFLNTFAFASFTPASIGALSKVINGELEALITASEIPAANKLRIYLSSSDFSEGATSPFQDQAQKYLSKSNKDFSFDLDDNKNYVFELVNNNPVMFAQSGLVLQSAHIQNGGDDIYLYFYCIDKDAIGGDVYIKITEGDI